MGAFTVLPMSQEIELAAGEVYEGEITVANPADAAGEFSYYVTAVPYTVIGEDYTADLETVSDWTQLAEWIEIEEPTGVLLPNETRAVKFKISVPETAPAGGQYAAIAVRSSDEEVAGATVQIQNVFEIASVIFAKVEGETIHSGEILENFVPGFSVENPPISSVTLKNTGNVHEAAVVTIEVKNALTGAKVFPVAEDDTNEYVEYIMPETTRYSTREIDGLSSLGVFEISQTVSYLGQTSVETKTVLMCPVWFMVLIGLLIITAVFTIVRKIRGRTRV